MNKFWELYPYIGFTIFAGGLWLCVLLMVLSFIEDLIRPEGNQICKDLTGPVFVIFCILIPMAMVVLAVLIGGAVIGFHVIKEVL